MSQEFTGWRKSSRSAADGNCVEIAAGWRKSSHSDANGNCVEVGAGQRVVGVRDTQQQQLGRGPVLEFGAAAWRGFIADVKARPTASNQA
jgi:hypothetical protein